MQFQQHRSRTSHPISSFGRYLYLNAYAFLILGMGIGILFLPLKDAGRYFIYIQIILAFICLSVSVNIFRSWEVKKRKYDILMERNMEEFNPGSFRVFMRAPCGILLVKTVLRDLGLTERYGELRKYGRPLWKFIALSLRHKKKVPYKKTFQHE